MTDSADAVATQLVYRPGKDNSYGQATLPRSLPKLVPRLLEFFETCTISPGPTSISVQAYGPTTFDEGRSVADRCFEKVTDAFGAPNAPADFFIGPVGGPSLPMNAKWNFPDHRFYEAVEFILKGHPWPKQLLGPVTLQFSYSFKWRDPRSGQEFRSENGAGGGSELSEMLVSLERSSLIQPDFVFPYRLDDSRLFDMLATVGPRLPIQLATKHFRLRVQLKLRAGFRWKRLSEQDQLRLSELAR